MRVADWLRRRRSRTLSDRQPPQETPGRYEEIAAEVPRVCIVTPVFNGADYIDETIYSVLSQSGDFVLHYHIQDGGSTDGTRERVAEWMRLSGTLPRLCRRIVFTCASAPDAGMYDAINKGFAAGLPPGDDVVMGWIAADDRLASGAFAAIAEIRGAFPEIRFLGGRISLIDQFGGVIGVHGLIPFSQRCMIAGLYDGRALNFIMQEGTFWCADLWRKVGGLDTRFRLAGDWDLWRRMAIHAPYVSADTILGFHRRRPGQLSEQMNRYYAEVDRMLDDTRGAAVDPALASTGRAGRMPASLREAYDDIAIEHELIRRDPPRFRASRHAATVVRYNLGARLWERTDGFGMVPGATDLVTPAGTSESRPVRLTGGFKAAEGPYPEHGLQTMIRWMDGPRAEGEVLIARPGCHRIVLRCRSWTIGQSVVLSADGRPIGRLAVTPHEHDRDLLLSAEATLDIGRHALAVTVDQPPEDTRYLLVIDWWVERLIGEDRSTVLPAPARPIGLASRGTVPPQADWPRISLVVPTRDHGHFIRDTLHSIIRQGYPNLELIVADGGSSDQTRRILREFSSHITHLVSEPDRGQSDAINKGFRAATGDVLGWLNSDDLLADGALHAIGHAFLVGDSDIVAGACDVFDDRGTPTHRHLPCLRHGPLPLNELLDLENHWLRGRFFHQPEVFFTRRIWERAGARTDESLYFSMDYDLWVRMAQAGATIRTIGAVVARYRLHPAQKTSTPQAYLPELTRHASAHREALGLGAPPARRELRSRLRVLFFNDCGFRYGAGIAHRRMAETLAALGHDVSALAYADFHRGRPIRTMDSEAVALAIAEERPDLVIVGNLHLISADFDLLGALVARDIPTIFYAHDQWIATGRCAYPGDCRRYLSHCDAACPTAHLYPALPPDRVGPSFERRRLTARTAAGRRFAILTNSSYMQRMLAGALPEDARPPIHLGPIGLDTRTFVRGDPWRARMLLELPHDAFIVMIAAADLRDERKGFGLLLDALAQLDDPQRLMLLVMGSAAPLPDLPFAVRSTGYLDDEALIALHYQAADLFVGPSLEEAFGQTFLEAGACEVPAIAFRVGGISDAVLDGVTGLLVEERTASALASAVATLRGDARLRRTLAIQARLHVVNRFSREASAAALTVVLVDEAALELTLAPNVSVAIGRDPLPLRYLVETGGSIVPPSLPWHPRRNMVEERRPDDRPDLPMRFWWATWPECAFLMPAGTDGTHTLQLTIRNKIEGQRLSVSVNDGPPQQIDVSAHDLEVVQTLQLGVDLQAGFNRVVMGFAGSEQESGGPQRSLCVFVEDISCWYGAPEGGEGLPDGTLELVTGFGPFEGPYPEHGLPEPIRWAMGSRCTLRLFASSAGPRCWELALRNDRPDQVIRIYVNNLLVASQAMGEPSLGALRHIRFEAAMLAGANMVSFEADRVLESREDTRPLAFIFESLHACPGEMPAWDADEIRWDLSEGFGPFQTTGTVSARPVVSPVASIVVECGRRGAARLILDAIATLPQQAAFLVVNERSAARLDFAAEATGTSIQVEQTVNLLPGRNTLRLQFVTPASDGDLSAGALVLLRSLRIERVGDDRDTPVRGSVQKWRCLSGFSDMEAPVPELGLPRPFRWATEGDNVLCFADPVTAFSLLIHNDFADQRIDVYSEEGALLSSTGLTDELSVLQEVPIAAPGEGTCGIRIRAHVASTASAHDPRRRCFILEDITDAAGNMLRQAS